MNLDYDGRRDYSLANRERSRSRGRSIHESKNREVNVGYDSLMSNQPDISMSRNSRSMSTPRHLVQDPINLEQKSRSAIPLISGQNDFELQVPNDVQLSNTNNSMSRSSHRRSSSVYSSLGNRSNINGDMRERSMSMDHRNRSHKSLPVAIPLHMKPLDNTVRGDLTRSKSRSRSRGRSRGRSSSNRDARSKSRGRSTYLQDEEKSASLRPSNRNSSYHSLASEFMALANAMNNALEGKPYDESKTQNVDERPVSRRKSRSKSMSRRMSRMNLDEDEQTVLPLPSQSKIKQTDPISMKSNNSNSRDSRRSLSISHHQPSTSMKRYQSERYFNGTSRGLNVSKSFHDFASVQDVDNGVRSLNQDRQGPSQRDLKITMNSMAFDSLPRLKQERRTSKLSRRSSSRIRSSTDMSLLTSGPKHVSPFFNDSDHASMFKPRSNERINPMEVPEKVDVEKKPKLSSSASVKSFTSSKGKKSYSRYVSIESIQKGLRPHYPDNTPPSSFKDFDAWMEHCRDIIALRRRSKIAPNRTDPLRPMVQKDSLKYKPTNDISFMCDIERENNLIGLFKPSVQSEEHGISPFLAAVTQLKKDTSNSHLLDTSMKNLLSIVKLLPGNERCCDCGRFDGETPSVKILWASVSHATLLCGECAFRHVTDGLQSNIKSFGEDGDTNWNVDEVLTMLEGCNDAFQSYILKQNKKNNRSIMYGGLLSCTNGKLKPLYESTIVRQYKKDLAKKALKQRDSMTITRS